MLDLPAIKEKAEAATEGVLLELYGVWSEEVYAAGFMSADADTVASFREWLKQRPLVATEDYEKKMMAEFKRQGGWPEWWGIFADVPQLVEAYGVLVALDKLLRRHASGQAWFDDSVDKQALAAILGGHE